MTKAKTATILCAAILIGTASCKFKNASEEAKMQARLAEGRYDVVGMLNLGPFGEDEGKSLEFSGSGSATNLGNAVLSISYVSDKTGDTNAIIADINEEGRMIFRDFTITYEGVPCKTKMHSSQIFRHGNDTVAGSGSCTMTIFGTLSRDASLDVTAIRSH